MFIRSELLNGNLDILINELLNKEKDHLLFILDNIKYEIITTNNYNEFKNISTIKLGECENKLKKI